MGPAGQGTLAGPAGVWRLWGLAHKSLRAEAAGALADLGSVDMDDPEAWAAARARLTGLLQRLQAHQRLEADLLHAALEARLPGASAASGHGHAALHEDMALLQDLCTAVDRRQGRDRHGAAQALYRALALTTARCWLQFEREESVDAARLGPLIDKAECLRLARELGPAPHPGTLAPAERRWLAQVALCPGQEVPDATLRPGEPPAAGTGS